MCGMRTIKYPVSNLIPAPALDRCPADCDIADAVICWLRHQREVRSALMAARTGNSADAEVLVSNLRAAEKRADRLLALVLGWAA
jgi:hypothetical protein